MANAVVGNRLKEGNSLGETNNDFSASQKCCILGGKKENIGLAASLSYHATSTNIAKPFRSIATCLRTHFVVKQQHIQAGLQGLAIVVL